jgi:hypothetical protein
MPMDCGLCQQGVATPSSSASVSPSESKTKWGIPLDLELELELDPERHFPDSLWTARGGLGIFMTCSPEE